MRPREVECGCIERDGVWVFFCLACAKAITETRRRWHEAHANPSTPVTVRTNPKLPRGSATAIEDGTDLSAAGDAA